MRPTPIPDAEIWEGARRLVIAPPGGDMLDPDIAPVEVLLDQASIGPRMSARCILEDGDLDVLRNGGNVWVSFYGSQLIPFSVDVAGAADPGKPSVRVDVDTSTTPPRFEAFVFGVPEADMAVFVEGVAEALREMVRRQVG